MFFWLSMCIPMTAQLVGRVASSLLGERSRPSSTHGLCRYHWKLWRGPPHYQRAVVKTQAPHSVSTDTAEECLRRGTLLPRQCPKSKLPPWPLLILPLQGQGGMLHYFVMGRGGCPGLTFSIDTTVGVGAVRERQVTLDHQVVMTVQGTHLASSDTTQQRG